MSLAAVLAAGPSVAPPRVRCNVAVVLDRMDDDTREAFVAALDPESGWQGTALARELQAAGYAIKSPSIQRHRNRGCFCDAR